MWGVACTSCGSRLNPNAPTTYQRVTGWEHRRAAGGTNALALREVHQEWICEACLERRKAGRDAQLGLL